MREANTRIVDPESLDRRLAARLRALRAERGWSLETLAEASGVSRASLSRIETGAVSPTASVLGRLCAAFGLPVSRVLQAAEAAPAPLLRQADQAVWRDPAGGLTRRSVSPPAAGLAGTVVEVTLAPGAEVDYPEPPQPGQEHHIVLLDGALTVALGAASHALAPGDCLRYRLAGPSRFASADGARYLVFAT